MRELPEPRAREAAPCLARLFAEASPPHQLFGAAHDALEAMGPAAAEAVPILIAQLRTGNAGSRAAAARALGLLGGAARPAVPALLAMLQDDGRANAEAAATAFLLLGPFARPALPALIQAYEADPASLRGPMVPLAKLGTLFPEARQAIARVLAHPDENARLLAVPALGLIRGAAADCLPALDAAAASSTPMVSVAARTVAKQLRQPEAGDFSTPEELARRAEEMRRGFASGRLE